MRGLIKKIGSTWESADNIDGTHTCRDPDDNRLLGWDSGGLDDGRRVVHHWKQFRTISMMVALYYIPEFFFSLFPL